MNGRKVFYTEIAYILGLVLLAFGTALMERADNGNMLTTVINI